MMARLRDLDISDGFGYHASRLAGVGSAVVLVSLPPVAEVSDRRPGTVPATFIEVIGVEVIAVPSGGVDADSVDLAVTPYTVHDLSEGEGVDLLGRVGSADVGAVSDFAGEVGPGSFGLTVGMAKRTGTSGASDPLATVRPVPESVSSQGSRVGGLPEPITSPASGVA